MSTNGTGRRKRHSLSPQQVTEELVKLKDRKGRLTAEKVVRVATPPSHPLHDQFDWDNRAAGHKWRLEQARSLIALHVVVVFDRSTYNAEGFSYTGPAFMKDPETGNRPGYRYVGNLRDDPDNAKLAIQNELSTALTYVHRVAVLANALGFARYVKPRVEAIEKLLAQIEARVG